MITKERLQELIEQGATIWDDVHCQIKLINDSKHKIRLLANALYVAEQFENCANTHTWWEDYTIGFYDIYENEEESEWFAEFGCIERTERLVLPTWEEFDGQKFVWFWDKDHKPCCLHYLNCNNMIFVNVDNKVIEIGELTKENYYEACKLAKSLFLGEKK